MPLRLDSTLSFMSGLGAARQQTRAHAVIGAASPRRNFLPRLAA
jgi:hypothetical protein